MNEEIKAKLIKYGEKEKWSKIVRLKIEAKDLDDLLYLYYYSEALSQTKIYLNLSNDNQVLWNFVKQIGDCVKKYYNLVLNNDQKFFYCMIVVATLTIFYIIDKQHQEFHYALSGNFLDAVNVNHLVIKTPNNKFDFRTFVNYCIIKSKTFYDHTVGKSLFLTEYEKWLEKVYDILLKSYYNERKLELKNDPLAALFSFTAIYDAADEADKIFLSIINEIKLHNETEKKEIMEMIRHDVLIKNMR